MRPETRYARSGDVNIAYQVVGEGPRDLVLVPGWVSNLDVFWDEPSMVRFLQRLASFARLILFDKRGTGLSDRVADLPNLEVVGVDCCGFGREKTRPHRHVPHEDLIDFVDHKAILVAAADDQAEAIARRIEALARTGQPGDGKVIVVPLAGAVRIETGQRGEAALR